MSMAVTTDAGVRERGRRATSSDSPRGVRARAQRRPRETGARGRGSATRVSMARASATRGASAINLVREKTDALLGLLGRFRVAVVVTAVLLVVVFSLYSPLKALWSAWRDNVAQQEELAALEETNEQYQSDIDRLQTTEGVEDEARRRGYVYEGETEVVVEGTLSEDDTETDVEDDDVAWYISLGDIVFGYEN